MYCWYKLAKVHMSPKYMYDPKSKQVTCMNLNPMIARPRKGWLQTFVNSPSYMCFPLDHLSSYLITALVKNVICLSKVNTS